MLNPKVSAADHIQGDPAAPVVLVEYGDYECPHCGHAYPIVQRLQKHFGKRLAFVYRNFPLSQSHPNAEHAAETAEFAGAQGRFWEMHDLLFENQSNLELDGLVQLAEALGLSSGALVLALENEEFAERVRNDFRSGVRSGVNGTPTFFINSVRHDDMPDYEALAAAIEAQLA